MFVCRTLKTKLKQAEQDERVCSSLSSLFHLAYVTTLSWPPVMRNYDTSERYVLAENEQMCESENPRPCVTLASPTVDKTYLAVERKHDGVLQSMYEVEHSEQHHDSESDSEPPGESVSAKEFTYQVLMHVLGMKQGAVERIEVEEEILHDQRLKQLIKCSMKYN